MTLVVVAVCALKLWFPVSLIALCLGDLLLFPVLTCDCTDLQWTGHPLSALSLMCIQHVLSRTDSSNANVENASDLGRNTEDFGISRCFIASIFSLLRNCTVLLVLLLTFWRTYLNF